MFGSNPITVNISELFVILGPDLLHRSQDSDYEPHDTDLIAPYSEANSYHIARTTLAVRRRVNRPYNPSNFSAVFICL